MLTSSNLQISRFFLNKKYNNKLKRPVKQVATCCAGGEALARTIGIVSLSQSMQKNMHAAADWFPKSTAA